MCGQIWFGTVHRESAYAVEKKAAGGHKIDPKIIKRPISLDSGVFGFGLIGSILLGGRGVFGSVGKEASLAMPK